jgi:hypothetical protein
MRKASFRVKIVPNSGDIPGAFRRKHRRVVAKSVVDRKDPHCKSYWHGVRRGSLGASADFPRDLQLHPIMTRIEHRDRRFIGGKLDATAGFLLVRWREDGDAGETQRDGCLRPACRCGPTDTIRDHNHLLDVALNFGDAVIPGKRSRQPNYFQPAI